MGAVIDESMADRISVTLIATGFDETKTLKTFAPETRGNRIEEGGKEKTKQAKGLSLVSPTEEKTIPLPPPTAAHPENPPIPLFDRDGGAISRSSDRPLSFKPSKSNEESCDQTPDGGGSKAEREAGESSPPGGRANLKS